MTGLPIYPPHDELDVLHRPDKPGSRYWRITFYNQEREYVKADILEVNKKNGLVFKRMTVFDAALNKATEYVVSHSINRELWSSVTECSKTGVPLWLFEYAGPVYGGEDPEDDELDLKLETLRLLIKSTNQKIEALNERAIRKTEE